MYFRCCSYCGDVQSVYDDKVSEDFVIVHGCEKCDEEKSKRNTYGCEHLQELIDHMNTFEFGFGKGDKSVTEFGQTYNIKFKVEYVSPFVVVSVWDEQGMFSEDFVERFRRKNMITALFCGHFSNGEMLSDEQLNKLLQTQTLTMSIALSRDFSVDKVYSKWESENLLQLLMFDFQIRKKSKLKGLPIGGSNDEVRI